jgi:hypothetical protein
MKNMSPGSASYAATLCPRALEPVGCDFRRMLSAGLCWREQLNNGPFDAAA